MASTPLSMTPAAVAARAAASHARGGKSTLPPGRAESIVPMGQPTSALEAQALKSGPGDTAMSMLRQAVGVAATLITDSNSAHDAVTRMHVNLKAWRPRVLTPSTSADVLSLADRFWTRNGDDAAAASSHWFLTTLIMYAVHTRFPGNTSTYNQLVTRTKRDMMTPSLNAARLLLVSIHRLGRALGGAPQRDVQQYVILPFCREFLMWPVSATLAWLTDTQAALRSACEKRDPRVVPDDSPIGDRAWPLIEGAEPPAAASVAQRVYDPVLPRALHLPVTSARRMLPMVDAMEGVLRMAREVKVLEEEVARGEELLARKRPRLTAELIPAVQRAAEDVTATAASMTAASLDMCKQAAEWMKHVEASAAPAAPRQAQVPPPTVPQAVDQAVVTPVTPAAGAAVGSSGSAAFVDTVEV